MRKPVLFSVNVNKVALIRNSRGGDKPNLIQVALDAEQYGAQGITVHPRPDQRHIRYEDIYNLKNTISTELNVEGNPKEQRFVKTVLDTKPSQVTLVPDEAHQLTSTHGWDTKKHQAYLKDIIKEFKEAGIRVSIFIDPVNNIVEGAAEAGADRIELGTYAYAVAYHRNKEAAIKPYIQASLRAQQLGLGVNAGHDLDLDNLSYLAKHIPNLLEVSIGHALIGDALYYGLRKTIQMYRKCLAV